MLYLGPRTLLVDQAVLRFRGIKLDRKINRRQRVYTTLYHSRVEGGSQTLDERAKRSRTGKNRPQEVQEQREGKGGLLGCFKSSVWYHCV